MLKKIWKYKYFLRSIFSTVYFNFRYLPLKQACKLPIILYKPKLEMGKGKIVIDSEQVSPGMIVLGKNMIPWYPYNGVRLECKGTIVFEGRCCIGNNACLCVGEKGRLVFGEGFMSTSTLNVICFHEIVFGKRVLVGWNNMFMDTDLHRVKCGDEFMGKGFGPIRIGHNNWLANNCVTMKNTTTPEDCVVASNSLLNKGYDVPPRCLLGGSPARVLKQGVWRDPDDDAVDYEV